MNDNEQWQPKGAPDPKKDFQNSKENSQEHSDEASLSPVQQEYRRYFMARIETIRIRQETTCTVSSKSELEQLLLDRQTQTPKPSLDFTPNDNAFQAENQQQAFQTRENRIHALVSRLAPMTHKSRDDFNINADTFLHEKTRIEQQSIERD